MIGLLLNLSVSCFMQKRWSDVYLIKVLTKTSQSATELP